MIMKRSEAFAQERGRGKATESGDDHDVKDRGRSTRCCCAVIAICKSLLAEGRSGSF